MFDDSQDSPPPSYWPSVGDLFMTLFIIALILLAAFYYTTLPVSQVDYKRIFEVVGGVELNKILEPTNKMRRALSTPLPELKHGTDPERVIAGLSETADSVVAELHSHPDISDLKRQIADAQLKIKEKDKKIQELSDLLQKEIAENTGLETENAGLKGALNDKPPIIKIAEAGEDGKTEYRFASGKAKVDDKFENALKVGGFKTLADEILKRASTVDTLEIIGHTDGVAVSHRGNLDEFLPAFLARKQLDLTLLIPGSNNDLGLLRALAIKEKWQAFVTKHPKRDQLERIDVRCYSAGQTVPDGVQPGETNTSNPTLYSAENEKSRRIEIRLTKLR